MRKKYRLFKIITTVLSLFIVLPFLSGIIYLSFTYQSISDPTVVKKPQIYYSQIYDRDNNLVKSLGSIEEDYIKYDDIPKTLVDALLAVEDISFFDHDGFDIRRIASSFINNIFSNKIEGASTITQQLSKNLFLSPKRTIERKIQELMLSLALENKYSKEEILEFYFNMVFFDGPKSGIAHASRKFFSKRVQELTLVECATLVGLVKSPTAYNPINHPQAANDRKEVVLKAMYKYGYLTLEEYQHALKIHVEDIVNPLESNQITYDYQSYLDCVYQEVEELLGVDPFSTPLEIETYIDLEMQSYIDGISNGDNYSFLDDLQQIGLALIDNDNGECIAISGGRFYQGEKLYNRAKNMSRGPASTIKPIFEYALAIEHLGYNSVTHLIDVETYYPNGQQVHNAGNSYAGHMTLLEALGYSKNTVAIKTLMKLQDTLGSDYLENYLNDIGMMDEGDYTLSYGLGGMKYGVSPLSLASAYSMLARGGEYIKPRFIKSIRTIPNGELLYTDESSFKRVLSEKTSFMVSDILQNIVNQDYVSLRRAKPSQVDIFAKTGTGAYDSNTIREYGYPSAVDKDIWLAGYSPSYSLAIWSGFDVPIKDQKTYFYKGDKRRNVTKDIFKMIMEKINVKNEHLERPSGLIKVPLVKYVDGYYLANEYIPNSYVQETYVKDQNEFEQYPNPVFTMEEPVIFLFDNKVELYLKELKDRDSLYELIYGKIGYFITIKRGNEVLVDKFIEGQNFEYYHDDINNLTIEIKVGYEKLSTLYSDVYMWSANSVFTPF